VDGAIHRAAGPELVEECRAHGGCLPGQAQITKGYRLPAQYVIHTVGPIWHGGDRGEPELLRSCYRSCFRWAVVHDLHTIAFPSISTGAYRYPIEQACRIALSETADFLAGNKTIKKVAFVCFDVGTHQAYLAAAKSL
jgi:O-acetyl-ADP-ribose deacetylase (regulator of RNase III)